MYKRRPITLSILLLLLSSPAYAGDLHLLNLDQMYFEYYKIENHRDAYYGYPDSTNPTDEEKWNYGVASRFDFNLMQYLDYGVYWNNTVRGQFTTKQVREVGWQFEFGAHLGEKLDVFHYHYSRHIMEDVRTIRYPLDNWTGIRVNFYKSKGY